MDMDALVTDHVRGSPRYAVIFRTHFWDSFAARQLQRLRQRVRGGDIFVVVDETRGAVEGIDHDRVVRVTTAEMSKLGLPPRGANALDWVGDYALTWFNGDYALYAFLRAQPEYRYYVQLEYDVVLNADLDALVARCSEKETDFVGLTRGEPVDVWAWRHTCIDAYAGSQIRYKLICFCVFSHRALQHLFTRRLALAEHLRPEQAWPFCEGFVATEVELAGMNSHELAEFLDVSAYNTWPPTLETDLPGLADKQVIHPVLDQPRYVASMLKYKIGLLGYLNPTSLFHRKLRRLPLPLYVQTLASTFASKAQRTFRNQRVARH